MQRGKSDWSRFDPEIAARLSRIAEECIERQETTWRRQARYSETIALAVDPTRSPYWITDA